jgi:Plant transposon protein
MERDKVFFVKQYLKTLTDEEWCELLGEKVLPGAKNVKRRRASETRNLVDYTTTKWGQLLKDPTLSDPSSPKAKIFRRRFRMPYNLFLYVVARCKEKAIFSNFKSTRGQIPDEIKLMACLRILGRDNCFDDISEFSDMGESTALHVFKKFVYSFSINFEKEFITIPEGEDLKKVMDIYSKLGLPGCIGSIDATHLKWAMCPKSLSNICNGKEAFPTIAYQAVVDHSRKILHITQGMYGSTNDITITKYDEFCRDVKRGKVFKDVEFSITDENEGVHKCKGVYFICDGGYPKDSYLINPFGARSDMAEVYWSEWLESVRKDVECTFGVLKARFRILRNGMRFHKKIIVDAVMITCCILHNMLLHCDGLDMSQWDNDEDWENIDPNAGEEEDIEDISNTAVEVTDISSHTENNPATLFATLGTLIPDNNSAIITPAEVIQRDMSNHRMKRRRLVRHFATQYKNGKLEWPKGFKQKQKTIMPLKPNVYKAMIRARSELEAGRQKQK